MAATFSSPPTPDGKAYMLVNSRKSASSKKRKRDEGPHAENATSTSVPLQTKKDKKRKSESADNTATMPGNAGTSSLAAAQATIPSQTPTNPVETEKEVEKSKAEPNISYSPTTPNPAYATTSEFPDVGQRSVADLAVLGFPKKSKKRKGQDAGLGATVAGGLETVTGAKASKARGQSNVHVQDVLGQVGNPLQKKMPSHAATAALTPSSHASVPPTAALSTPLRATGNGSLEVEISRKQEKEKSAHAVSNTHINPQQYGEMARASEGELESVVHAEKPASQKAKKQKSKIATNGVELHTQQPATTNDNAVLPTTNVTDVAAAMESAPKKVKKRKSEQTSSRPVAVQPESTPNTNLKAAPQDTRSFSATDIAVSKRPKKKKHPAPETLPLPEVADNTRTTTTSGNRRAGHNDDVPGLSGDTRRPNKSKKRKSDGPSAAGENAADAKTVETVQFKSEGGMQEHHVKPQAVITDPTPKKKKREKERGEMGLQGSAVKSELADNEGALTADHSTEKSTTRVRADDEKRLKAHPPFVQITKSLYLPLSPCANDFPLEGLLAEHVSPLYLSYYPPLKGVILAYGNARISEHPSLSPDAEAVLGKAVDEYAVTFVWLTADYLLFRPSRGTYLDGYVNLQNESLLGLMCYNYFNAAIERKRLPKDWFWKAEENGESMKHNRGTQSSGYWVDGNGEKVEGRLAFRVCDYEATTASELGAGSISIAGTLLSEEEDGALDDEERQQGLIRHRIHT